MTQLVNSLGVAVRQLRERQGWSQEVLALHADLNRSYVGELERGQAIPSLVTLQKLAYAFGISLSGLVAHGERIAQSRLTRGLQLAAIAC